MENSAATSDSSPPANHGAPPPLPPPTAATSTTTTARSNDLIPTETITPAREESDRSRPNQNLVSGPGDTIDPPAHSTISAGHGGHVLIATETITNNTTQQPAGTGDGAGTGAGTGTGAVAREGTEAVIRTGAGAVGAGTRSATHPTPRAVVGPDRPQQPAPPANPSDNPRVVNNDTVQPTGHRSRRGSSDH